VARWERDFARLPSAHQQLLASQPAKYAAVRQRLRTNQQFISAMLSAFEADAGIVHKLSNGQHADGAGSPSAEPHRVSAADLEKACDAVRAGCAL
jgi:hypothetical protein